MAVAFPPNTPYIPCPRCQREHCHSGLLRVRGYTRRPFPQPAEVWAPAIEEKRFGADDNDEFQAPKPRRRKLLTHGQSASALS